MKIIELDNHEVTLLEVLLDNSIEQLEEQIKNDPFDGLYRHIVVKGCVDIKKKLTEKV